MFDHRPLTWLFNVKDPGSRLIRWRLALEEYEYEIKYKPGKINNNADFLSRNPINDDQLNSKAVIHNIQQTSDNYNEFLVKLQSSLITNNNIEERNNKLVDSSSNICVFIPTDLQFKENFQTQIERKYSYLNELKTKNPELNQVITFKEKNIQIIYVFFKENYWELYHTKAYSRS